MPAVALPARSPHVMHNHSSARVGGGKKTPVFMLALILLLCVGLRIYHLGAASLWGDEIFSRYYLDVFGNHFAFHDGLALETNPPTYYFLLQGWMELWGHSEAAMRSLSALASTLSVPFLYLLGRELAGKWRGLLSALLFAICPTSVYFAQEARSYAFLTLAGAMLLWAAAVFQRNFRSTKATVTYILGGTLCLYLHATGLLFVAACGTAVWLFLARRGRRGRKALAKWTAMNVAIVLLGVPYYAHAFTASQSGIINYVPAAGLHQFIYSSSLAVSGIVTPYPWPGLLLAAGLLGVLAISLCINPVPSRAMVTLLGVPCLFVAFVFVVSMRRPILLPRTLIWLIVPICVLAARQILVGRIARYAVLLTVTAAFGAGLFFQLTRPNADKEPLRDVVKALSPGLEQADLVVLSPSTDPMVLAYYAPEVKDVRVWDSAGNHTIFGAAARSAHVPSISEPEILQAIQAGKSVVLISHSFDLDRLNELRQQQPTTSYREWKCGKVVCVVAATWQPTTKAAR